MARKAKKQKVEPKYKQQDIRDFIERIGIFTHGQLLAVSTKDNGDFFMLGYCKEDEEFIHRATAQIRRAGRVATVDVMDTPTGMTITTLTSNINPAFEEAAIVDQQPLL